MAYLRPDASEAVMIPSLYDPMQLEARIQRPTRSDADGGGTYFVICHPYGPMGGNMHNNVVAALHELATGLGYGTCRLNFRGVGRSGGSTSNSGEDEEGDIRSAIRYMLYSDAFAPPRPKNFVLCGYSYGAMVTGSVAHESFPPTPISPSPTPPGQPNPIVGWLSISYPFGALDKITLYSGTLVLNNASRYRGPKLLLFGSEDDLAGNYRQGLLPRLDKERLRVEVVEGADHFWYGEEGEITERVRPWLRDVVGLDVEPVKQGEGARL
ncbi:Alpha/Beta hydrolase protein [Hyaloraphidium curvatum]|nr:Alpha/Beta hydrolase protein [Hyaloraphidium curvatum]